MGRHFVVIPIIASFLGSAPMITNADVLEEIIVTAQKREQSLQDVGISITALSGEQVRDFRFVASTDIVAQIPGVQNFSTQGRGANSATYIRGVGLNDFGDAHEAPVTGYIDEFYMLPPAGLDFALYDLQRVEVLRGPQGTLFGRNTTGGLIHFVTNKPTKEFEASLDASYASFDEVRVEAVANGSLSENVSARASLLYHDGGAYIENEGPFPDGSDYGTRTGRLQILFEPRDDLEILAKVQYGEVDQVPVYTDHETAITDPATGLQRLNPGGVDALGYSERQVGVQDPRHVLTDNPQRLKADVFHGLLRVDWQWRPEISITSLTGYADVSRDNIEDCDGSPNNLCTAGFPVDHKIWTQELRLYRETDRTRITGGVFYLDQDSNAHPTAGFFGIPQFLDSPWDLQLESWSVFGHIEYDLAENWTVLGGLRFTSDDKFYEATNRFAGEFRNDADNFTVENVGDLTNREDDLVSGEIEIDWHPREDWLAYAKISRGTKAGGFNNGFYFVPTPEDVQFGDETLWSYEVGFKADLFERRARFNAAAFYYDYSDFQTFNWTGLSGSISNSDARNYGAEFEFAITPGPGWDISLGLSLLDTKIEDVNNGTIIRDVEMALASDLTFNGSVRYNRPMFDGNMAVLWDFNYASDRYQDNFNNPSSDLGETFVTNIRFSYLPPSGRWETSIFVQNITDEANLIKASPFIGFGFRQAVYDPPRRFGVSFRLNWQ